MSSIASGHFCLHASTSGPDSSLVTGEQRRCRCQLVNQRQLFGCHSSMQPQSKSARRRCSPYCAGGEVGRRHPRWSHSRRGVFVGQTGRRVSPWKEGEKCKLDWVACWCGSGCQGAGRRDAFSAAANHIGCRSTVRPSAPAVMVSGQHGWTVANRLGNAGKCN